MNFQLGIVFPVEGELPPRCVWVRIYPNASDKEDRDPADWESHLQDPAVTGPGNTSHTVTVNLLGAGSNDHAIEIIVNMEYDEGQSLNRCVEHLDAFRWTSWQGPMLVMSLKGKKVDPPDYQDINLVDYRDEIDYLKWYIEEEGSGMNGGGADSSFCI